MLKRAAGKWLLPAYMALVLMPGGPVASEPVPVPPPLPQMRADCVRPQYASDALVCGDSELVAADAEVAALAATTPNLADGAVWEDQAAWLRRRSLCAFSADHRGCLVAAYADRRSVLSAATEPATQQVRCFGAWQGRSLTGSAIASGQPVTLHDRGLLLGVATANNALWQPMLSWRAAGHDFDLQAQDGRQFKCHLAPN